MDAQDSFRLFGGRDTFLSQIRQSHIFRHTILTTGLASLSIAAAFLVAFLLARTQAFADVEKELGNSTSVFLAEPDQFPDLKEFHEANPDLSAVVFDSSGSILGSLGSLKIQNQLGFVTKRGLFTYGRPISKWHVVVATPSERTEKALERLVVVLGILWVPLTALLGFVSLRSANAIFVPIQSMTQEAANLGKNRMGERLILPNGKEFRDLAIELNNMLARTEEYAERAEQFSADAAHELRTPLAILRTQIETTLLNKRSSDEYESALRKVLSESERLSELAEVLLASSRSERLVQPEQDISEYVRLLGVEWQTLFQESGQKLSMFVEPCRVAIGSEEVRVIVSNLLENARRYSSPGANTTLRLSRGSESVQISVADEGIGVPPEIESTLFDRFVRGEESRNREYGGFGVGLSLVKKIVNVRGGHIRFVRNPVGTTFICEFPVDVQLIK